MSSLDPCLAVIPARGGSKGLPGKNIRPLAGLPLLQHSIECSRLVSRIARAVVSTDSPEIAAVARAVGGEVSALRPPELAADDTPMMPVLQHELAQRELAENRRFGSVLLLDPTSPGRLPEDIDAAFAELDSDSACNGVVACSRPSFNPLWVGVFERDGYIAPAFETDRRYARRQDVPTFYRINGALYLWRSEFVRRASPAWLDSRHRMVEIPECRAFSIDDLFQFQVAELLLTRGLVRLPWVALPAESIP